MCIRDRPGKEHIGVLLQAQARTQYTRCIQEGVAVHHTVPQDVYKRQFLGDSVLQIVSADYLFHAYADRPEGDLTRIRASLVDVYKRQPADRPRRTLRHRNGLSL